MPECGGLSPSGASRSAKQAAAFAPTCERRKATQAEGREDFDGPLVPRGRVIIFSMILLSTITISVCRIIPASARSGKPLGGDAEPRAALHLPAEPAAVLRSPRPSRGKSRRIWFALPARRRAAASEKTTRCTESMVKRPISTESAGTVVFRRRSRCVPDSRALRCWISPRAPNSVSSARLALSDPLDALTAPLRRSTGSAVYGIIENGYSELSRGVRSQHAPNY